MNLSNGESSKSSLTTKNVFPPVAQALDLFDNGSLLNSDMYQQYLKSWTFLMAHSVIHTTKVILLQQRLTAELWDNFILDLFCQNWMNN